MQIEKFYIPQSLDKPDILFYCTMAEWAMFASCIMVGLFMKSFGFGFLMGLGLMVIGKKLKEKVGNKQMLLLLYWHFPMWLSGFKWLPYSHKRTYII